MKSPTSPTGPLSHTKYLVGKSAEVCTPPAGSALETCANTRTSLREEREAASSCVGKHELPSIMRSFDISNERVRAFALYRGVSSAESNLRYSLFHSRAKCASIATCRIFRLVRQHHELVVESDCKVTVQSGGRSGMNGGSTEILSQGRWRQQQCHDSIGLQSASPPGRAEFVPVPSAFVPKLRSVDQSYKAGEQQG